MERRGFAFDDDSVIMKDGKLRAIYLKDDIAGLRRAPAAKVIPINPLEKVKG